MLAFLICLVVLILAFLVTIKTDNPVFVGVALTGISLYAFVLSAVMLFTTTTFWLGLLSLILLQVTGGGVAWGMLLSMARN